MKDILLDIVTHTRGLGVVALRIINDDDGTVIETMAADKTMIMTAKTHSPIEGFSGTFGVPNLDKLELLLRNPYYQENAEINIRYETKDGSSVPSSLEFINKSESFKDNYRFMSKEVLKEVLKNVSSRELIIEGGFEPSLTSIEKLKLKAQVHNESNFFKLKVENGDLVISFGDAANHSGSFVFEPNITAKLTNTWTYPVSLLKSIFDLHGTKIMQVRDSIMRIVVDSGMAIYTYNIPALTK